MPELPEVETIVRELRQEHLIGLKIVRATILWSRSIQTPDPDSFCQQIASQKISDITRRGKYIVFTLSKGILLVHLRMTGKFIITSKDEKPLKHERVQLYLSDGRVLRYEDQRKFGKLSLVTSTEEKFHELGLEPLSDEFTLKEFKNRVLKSSQRIKPYLMNQRHVAGLGNIYVDEALWEAKIHPLRKANSLSEKEVTALFHAIPKVLLLGIENMGTSLGSSRANYFSVSGRRGGNQYKLKAFRQDGLPCPRCATTIIKIVVGQRGTHLCPNCQHEK